jgi:hypothetical protein
MKVVWTELFKRSGWDGSEYMHPANAKILSDDSEHPHPQWEAVKGLSNRSNAQDRLQEQACMVLLAEAIRGARAEEYVEVQVGSEVRLARVGPARMIQSRAEVKSDAKDLCELARRFDASADECIRLYCAQLAPTLRKMGKFLHEEAARRLASANLRDEAGCAIPNPWILDRDRGDRTLRVFVDGMVSTCRALFGKDLLGVVARVASVAHNSKVDPATVRGMVGGYRQHRT